MNFKKLIILGSTLLLIIGVFYYGKQFLDVDKCLDNGGSFNYKNNECVFRSLLNNINLSDEKVSTMSRDELWKIGVKHLGWPAELPRNITKDTIHQKLLDAKYAKVGDLGDKSHISIDEIGSKDLYKDAKLQ